MLDKLFTKDPHSHAKKKDYTFLSEPLGSGGYAVVRLARWHPKQYPELVQTWIDRVRRLDGDSGTPPASDSDSDKVARSGSSKREKGLMVAVKVVKKEAVANNPEYIKILNVGHKVFAPYDHICYCFDWFQSDSKYYLSFPLLQGGELLDRINTRGRFKEVAAKKILRVMLETLAIIHSKNLIHRDIKPDNFLYRRKDSAVDDFYIIDFGISKWLTEEAADGLKTFEIAGTPGYAAPEVFARTGYGMNADVFGVGVIAWNILSASTPWKESDYVNLIRETMTVEPEMRLGPWKGVSSEAKEFVRFLMQKDPLKRPSAAQALEHPYLQTSPTALSPAPSIDLHHFEVREEVPLPRPVTLRPSNPIARVMTAGGILALMSSELANQKSEAPERQLTG